MSAGTGEVSLIIRGARVLTMDRRRPRAAALAVGGERIVRVGEEPEVLALAGPGARVVNLRGRTVAPGFIDSHVHAAHYGLYMLPRFVQFEGCRSVDDLLARVEERARVTRPGEWILGSPNYPTDLVDDSRFPDRWELDRAAPHHPFFMRIRGHLGVVNSRALERFGIDRHTPDPEGGYIFRDPSTGEPTGWVLDNALFDLVLPHLPPTPSEEWREAIRAMSRHLLQLGVTTVVNQSADARPVLEDLHARGELPVRWQANLRGSSDYFHRPLEEVPAAVEALGPPTGHGDRWLWVGAIGELHADGLVEAPLMHEPFAEDRFGPGWRGLLRHPPGVLEAVCQAAAERGFQVEVHASGDAALELVLDVYEAVDRRVGIRDRRWIITHGGVFPGPRSVERARELGVVVATQQPVIWTQSHYYRRYWGRLRADNLFANRTWLEGGVRLNGGSDVGLPPLLGIATYVNRRNVFGEEVGLEQAIDPEQALRLYTADAAYSIFREHDLGSVEAGKLADLVVLSGDPLSVPPERLSEIKVLATLVGGRVAHDPEGLFSEGTAGSFNVPDDPGGRRKR